MDAQMALLNKNMQTITERNEEFEKLRKVWQQFMNQARQVTQSESNEWWRIICYFDLPSLSLSLSISFCNQIIIFSFFISHMIQVQQRHTGSYALCLSSLFRFYFSSFVWWWRRISWRSIFLTAGAFSVFTSTFASRSPPRLATASCEDRKMRKSKGNEIKR